jgi:hypothetical protein
LTSQELLPYTTAVRRSLDPEKSEKTSEPSADKRLNMFANCCKVKVLANLEMKLA